MSLAFKLEWLREKIANTLGVIDREFSETLINDNIDEFTNYVEGEIHEISEIDKRVVFAYRTFYEKLVEQEITMMELVPPPAPPDPTDSKLDRKGKKGKVKGKDLEIADNIETPRSGKIFF